MSIKDKILNGDYDNAFSKLYKDISAARERYVKTVDGFYKTFENSNSVRLFSGPGRTEVGGNHTDHQHGCVLAGSVDLDAIGAAAENGSSIVRIKSEGFPMDEVDLNNLESSEKDYGRSSALIRGMLRYMRDAGYRISGFDAYTSSNVLKGSGLSSSAAFEVLVGNIIRGMFSGGSVTDVDIAIIAQKSENIYFGKPCGLMDQMASSVGGFTAIDFYNPEKPLIEKIDFDLARHGVCLCIVDTGGNHADLTPEYAAIPAECKKVAEFFGKSYLREVTEEEFFANIAKLRPVCGDRAILRAMHFFSDNKTAQLEKIALTNDNFDEFLRLVKFSGDSSFKYLQNVYASSAPAEQGLSLALALAEKVLGSKGACRVHGGGFAGTIQAFVPFELKGKFKSVMQSVFGDAAFHELDIRPIGGTEIKE